MINSSATQAPTTRRSLTTGSSARAADRFSPGWHAALSGVLAVCAAIGTFALRTSGILTGLPVLILVVLLLIALPTAHTLSGRVLLTGAAVLGWNQVLWWWSLPYDRMTIALVALCGAWAGYIAWRLLRGQSLRRMLPEVVPADVIPWLAALLGLLAFAPALVRVSRASALALLIPGWDNSAHFNMFHMILTHGRTIDSLPQPSPGNQWIYFDYPQAFHATAASVTQLLWPHAAADIGASLVAYNRSTALIVVAAVVTIVAGITSIPAMRQRWTIAAPLAALVASAFFFGPGMVSVHSGFASFVLPCALIGVALFVAVAMDSPTQTWPLLALGGTFVGVAHGWILLLALMAPVVTSVAFPFTAARWKAPRRQWLMAVLIGMATIYGVLRAATIVLRSANAATLTAPGGITPPPIGILIALTFGALASCLAASASARTHLGRHDGATSRLLVSAFLILIAVVVAIYLATKQIDVNGTVGYYFWKFLTGFELVVVVLLAAAISVRVRPAAPGSATLGRVGVFTATIAGSVALTQVFGYAGPTSQHQALASTDPVSVYRAQFYDLAATRDAAAQQLLAASTAAPAGLFDSAYLGPPGELDPINAQQWYLALRGTWTIDGNYESTELVGAQADVAATKAVALKWLDKHSGILVVPPDVLAALASLDGSHAAVARLATW